VFGRPLVEHHYWLDLGTVLRGARGQPRARFPVSWGSAAAVDVALALDAPEPGRGGLRVRWAVEGRAYQVVIALEATPQRLGGRRWWARCPGCGRRCAKVALTWASDGMGCRVCLRLAYESTREKGAWRALGAARALRLRHGGRADAFSLWSKPRGMHVTTWIRLVQRHQAYMDRFVEGFPKLFPLPLPPGWEAGGRNHVATNAQGGRP
jgi:hypothetical protein